MVRANEGFLSQFTTRVCLGVDESVGGESIYDSELILRKEPFVGHFSTIGPETEEKSVRVLREMVRLQAGFVKPPYYTG